MSNRLRKHARFHHAVGLDPLDLASIAGTLTDAQHATKTGIPDDHHSSNQPLTEHSDAEIVTPADAEVLTYEAATALWKNKPAPAAAPHADTHHAGGTDPLDLALIAGTITETQHETKTGIPDAHHRKIGWSDEPSWIRTYVLPLSSTKNWTREPTNPVITRNLYNMIQQPNVIYRDGTYYLYASAHDGTQWAWIVLWTSPDGISWTHYGKVISTVPGTWEDNNIIAPKVIYDLFETDPAKKWKMWYEGRVATGVRRVGLAYSSDGKTWTKYAGNPLTIPNYLSFSISVLRFGNLFYGVYKDVDKNLRKALSGNGIDWDFDSTILSTGGTGEWDELAINEMTLFWTQGVYYLFYTGQRTAVPQHAKIGLALYSNGMDYKKWDANPVIDIGASGEWDDYHVALGTVLQMGKKFMLWYHGYNGTYWQIGLATIP